MYNAKRQDRNAGDKINGSMIPKHIKNCFFKGVCVCMVKYFIGSVQ